MNDLLCSIQYFIIFFNKSRIHLEASAKQSIFYIHNYLI